jgi:hypothetical protein
MDAIPNNVDSAADHLHSKTVAFRCGTRPEITGAAIRAVRPHITSFITPQGPDEIFTATELDNLCAILDEVRARAVAA